MKHIAFASIQELQQALARKDFSSRELLEFFRARFQKYEQLGACLELFDTDSILQSSSTVGSLAGIPGIVKDNICQRGRITSCASKILSNYTAAYDATAVARLKNEGALFVGRANCDEFAMGSSGEYSSIKPTANPWNKERVSGGSSSGPVASVAAGLVPWALGSETGGSVRLPAAFCGVVGLKPTYGLISRYGLVAYASSLDQIGIATRTVRDAAQILSIIAGVDAHDATTRAVHAPDYTKNLAGTLRPGMTIGVIDNMMDAPGVEDEIKQALEAAINEYKKMGAVIKHITLPMLEYGAAVYFIISRAEAASNLARFDGVRFGKRVAGKNLQELYEKSRHDGFGDDVRVRIIVGNYVLSAEHAAAFYKTAKRVQRLILADFERAFQEVDVLFAPVHAGPAFKFGQFSDNKLQMDLTDYFTSPVNLAGIPALSVPCGFTADQLPIGFQLIGPALSEELLFHVGNAYEQRTPWHTMTPPLYAQ